MTTPCFLCQRPIDPERLDALPHTKYCVDCATKSTPEKPVGFMVFDHKTAPYLIQIPASNKEAIRQATRATRRSR